VAPGTGQENDPCLARFFDLVDRVSQLPGQCRSEGVSARRPIQDQSVKGSARLGQQLV
jgi:hypothetical protein